MSRVPSSPCSHLHEIHQITSDIFEIQDMSKVELFHLLKAVSHLLSHLIGEYRRDGKLSQARMRLLVQLVIEERMGNDEGLLPSELSQCLRVSRNTVSALLNGLEEQGLIERHLHPTNRRQLLIRVTPAGRELVHTCAPQVAAYIASLFEALSLEERQTLFLLLDKLYHSMLNRAAEQGINVPGMGPEISTEQA